MKAAAPPLFSSIQSLQSWEPPLDSPWREGLLFPAWRKETLPGGPPDILGLPWGGERGGMGGRHVVLWVQLSKRRKMQVTPDSKLKTLISVDLNTALNSQQRASVFGPPRKQTPCLGTAREGKGREAPPGTRRPPLHTCLTGLDAGQFLAGHPADQLLEAPEESQCGMPGAGSEVTDGRAPHALRSLLSYASSSSVFRKERKTWPITLQ